MDNTANHEVANTLSDLTDCKDCNSAFVYPVDWREGIWNHSYECISWTVDLRCPCCEQITSKIIEDEELVMDFDFFLDTGTDILVKSLRDQEYTNMVEFVNTFVLALEKELITADDFR